MFNPFNIRGRCKDAKGGYIDKGWYFHPDWGYIRLVDEEKSVNSFRDYSWRAECCYNGEQTRTLRLGKVGTSKCIRADEQVMAKFCARNAKWASKRLEDLAEEKQGDER